jgi:plasmid replication initiation protein
MLSRIPAKKNNIFNKNVGSIYIKNTLSLSGRQLWNILIKNVQNQGINKDRYEINVEALIELSVLFNSKNLTFLKNKLIELSKTVVEFNITGRDGSIWGAFNLIRDPEISNRKCFYSLSKRLKEFMCNPTIYAKIDLEITSRFQSVEGLILYEVCQDYKRKDQTGETPWIEIDQIRTVFGCEEKYATFTKFKKHIIEKAIEDANNSDESSIISVKYKNKPKTKKIEKLKFIIKPNEEFTEEFTNDKKTIDILTSKDKISKKIIEAIPKNEITENLLDFIKNCKLSEDDLLCEINYVNSHKPHNNYLGYLIKSVAAEWGRNVKNKQESDIVLPINPEATRYNPEKQTQIDKKNSLNLELNNLINESIYDILLKKEDYRDKSEIETLTFLKIKSSFLSEYPSSLYEDDKLFYINNVIPKLKDFI